MSPSIGLAQYAAADTCLALAAIICYFRRDEVHDMAALMQLMCLLWSPYVIGQTIIMFML